MTEEKTSNQGFEWKRPELVVGREYAIGETMVPHVYLGDVEGNLRFGLNGSLQSVRLLTILHVKIRMFGEDQITNGEQEFSLRQLHYAKIAFVPREERDEAVALLEELNEAREQSGEQI